MLTFHTHTHTQLWRFFFPKIFRFVYFITHTVHDVVYWVFHDVVSAHLTNCSTLHVKHHHSLAIVNLFPRRHEVLLACGPWGIVFLSVLFSVLFPSVTTRDEWEMDGVGVEENKQTKSTVSYHHLFQATN